MYVCPSQGTVPAEVRKGYQTPWNWSYKLLGAGTWILGTKPWMSEQPVFLTAELSGQPTHVYLLYKVYIRFEVEMRTKGSFIMLFSVCILVYISKVTFEDGSWIKLVTH